MQKFVVVVAEILCDSDDFRSRFGEWGERDDPRGADHDDPRRQARRQQRDRMSDEIRERRAQRRPQA
ncbi:MAG TPA: hypothetical protein VLH10_16600, partial [Yinghuangia sp.]|nr:hypothetical protein [Yinghuangia sp.]